MALLAAMACGPSALASGPAPPAATVTPVGATNGTPGVIYAQAATAPTMAGNSAVGPKITRAQIMQNALGWLAEDPPYSQTSYYPGIMNPSMDYRMDCSGFVSMAWGLTSSYVTWTIPSIAIRLPSVWDLQPGDVLDYPADHVVLFTGWIDKTRGTFSYIAQTMPGLNMQMVDTETVLSGNISGHPYADYLPYTYENVVASTPLGVRGDWDSNGTVDLLARNGTDTLYYYEGNGAGGLRFGAAPIATGYSQYVSVVRSPDLGGKRASPDLLGIDGTGTLWVMPSTGYGSFGPRLAIGFGWTGYRLLAPGDLNGDGHNDLLAVTPQGTLLYYAGEGGAKFRQAVQVGSGWTGLTPVSVGDFNSDGRPDLVATNAAGALLLYRGVGGGRFAANEHIGNGWAGSRLVGPGDFNRDGHQDLLAIDASGTLRLYPGSGAGTVGRPVVLAIHWRAITLL